MMFCNYLVVTSSILNDSIQCHGSSFTAGGGVDKISSFEVRHIFGQVDDILDD